jgi:hypothetical protein
MKPTFILINLGDKKIGINSQDLKTVRLRDGKATIVTSQSEIQIPCSDHMADRIKTELRQRYDFVHVTPDGTRVQNNRGQNSIFCMQTKEETLLIFPKALKFVEVNDMGVKAFMYHPKTQNRSFMVETKNPVRADFQSYIGTAVQTEKQNLSF